VQTTTGLPNRWLAALGPLDLAEVAPLAAAWQQLNEAPLHAAHAAERLFFRHRHAGGAAPAWLAFAIAVSGRIHTLSDFHPLDPLLAEFARRRPGLVLPEALLRELDACYFGGLVFRQPDHPQMAHWAGRCLAAFEAEGDDFARLSAANYLLLYRIWRGDLLGAESLSRRMTAIRERTGDVRTRLLSHSLVAMIRRLFVEYTECMSEVEQGLTLAEASGVHFWDSHFHMQGAFLALTRHNLEQAGEWLARMERSAPPEHYLDRSGYHYSRAWLHLLQNDVPLALRHAREAVTLAEKSGAVFPQAVTHIGLAQLYVERRRFLRALVHVGRARFIGRAMDSGYVPFARGLTRAHAAFSLGMEARGRRVLAQTLALGREQRYVNFPWWRGSTMATLCARALAAGIEPDYVRWLIRQRRLVPPPDLAAPESWYWALEVALLGGPTIRLDSQPLELGGKAHELLLNLACLGDGKHPVLRERLTDRLWPESEGDRAQRALDTAIHRLRRYLGGEEMILTRPGSVALNPALCRVDYWWLLRDLEGTEHGRAQLARFVEAAVRLPTAPDPLPKAALSRRIAAAVLERLDDAAAADREAWLETLLEAQPANERLWQALIRHHLALDLPSAAVAAWQRCVAALAAHVGVAPSAATRALVAELLQGPKP
jgi:DNA-binding SARP family transcriptional activator